jgi:hypothetical protein
MFISTFQKSNECKKFKHIILVYLDYLMEMLHGVTVDGWSSCIPGEASFPVDAYGDEYTKATGDDHDGTLNSLVSTNNHKRGSSATDTATCPRKKIKNPMARLLRGW